MSAQKRTSNLLPFFLTVVVSLFVQQAYASGSPGITLPDTIKVDSDSVVIVLKDGSRIVVNGDNVTGEGIFAFKFDTDELKRNMERFAITPDKFRFEHVPADWEVRTENLLKQIDPIIVDGPDFVFDSFDLGGPFFSPEFREERNEIVRLEREVRELAREARQAEGQERERLEAEIREKLETILDNKLSLRERHIEKLEERVNEERSYLQKRREARGEIINRRFRELLGEKDVFDW